MARDGARALAFVTDFETRCRAAFARECAGLEAFKAVRTGEAAGPLKAWEVSFWAEKMRREQHAFDDEELRPYFEVGRVQAGLWELARRVFGLRITELGIAPEEKWCDEVKYYEMQDEAGRQLGAFYADWHPREAKRGGARMGYLVTGGPGPDGGRAPHLGYICGNMSPPRRGVPRC